MPKKIILNTEPWVGKEELKELTDSIKAKWLSGGPKLKEFQEKIAKLCGVKHGIAVCNGTQALYIGLKILGIGPGDEVVVPDFTFIASGNAVIWTGAKPVFVDVDRKTFNIDPAKIEKAITKKTKAIMPVHIYGQGARMPEILKIAKKPVVFIGGINLSNLGEILKQGAKNIAVIRGIIQAEDIIGMAKNFNDRLIKEKEKSGG